MKIKQQLALAVFLLIVLAAGSCKQKEKSSNNSNDSTLSNDLIKHSAGFDIVDYENYTKVIINNPWDKKSNKPFAVYYLYGDDNAEIPYDDGFKIKIPISSVIVNTFSYFEFLNQLGHLDKVVAVTDAERIYNAEILDGLKNGRIQDLGDPFNPNIERTLMVKADALINSAYVQQDNLSERVQKTGLPVIYSLEWTEATPLARAEWIKLIAEFVGQRAMAQKLFDEIEQRYNNNIAIVRDAAKKPYVLSGDNFQDTWYVPGGDSFNAYFFRDAGANYYYADKNNETGSIGLDIESILTQFGQADVWVGCNANTYAELEGKDKKYTLLKSFKDKRVFNNLNRTTATGGNDYFESAIANPDLILRDLIKAFHPDVLEQEEFVYFKPLN